MPRRRRARRPDNADAGTSSPTRAPRPAAGLRRSRDATRESSRGASSLPAGEMRRRPHPRSAERGPVAPVAALRADDQRAGDALRIGKQAERLAAEAVPDNQNFGGEEPEGRRRVEQCPIAHARRQLADVAISRAADAAIVEGERAEAALGEVAGELR